MKKILIIISIFLFSFLYAQTTIPAGNVSGTWDFAGSPYLIEGEIEIPDGEILTIDPGCLVEFQGHYKFNVQGQLLAEGTEQDSIIFTAVDTNIGWNGIRFNNTPTTNDSTKIVHCILMNGIAEGYPPDLRGGAIYVNSFSKLSISDSRFENNQAIDAQPVGGGGIEKGSGGAIRIRNNSNIVIERTLFKMNEGHYGGTIYCSESQPSIHSCSFIENNGIFNGGGISTWDASIEVKNCIFYNNSSHVGGGINFDHQLNSVIINNIFSNNSADYGGAIYTNSSDNGNIINNLICNNYAEYGGGICCSFFDGEIINCTIAYNEAQYGGGIFFGNYSEPSVINTIAYSNYAALSGDQIYLQENPYFVYCNIEEGISGFGGNSSYNVQNYQNCIEEEPIFVSPSMQYGVSINGLLSDFSLDTYSPCIESGDPETDMSLLPLFDIAGNQRLVFDYIDIGAYEYTSYYADFAADPQSGDVPLTVQFYDGSVGLPTFWEWDFENDGSIDSYEQNPLHTYELYGNYSVSLLSGNNTQSDIITKPDYINVNYSLIAQFSANILSGYAPLEITFINESYGDIISWEWDFNNDGLIDSYLQNPTWEYTDPGVYSVSLTVSDDQLENTLVKEDYIIIFPDNEISGIIAEDLILEADTVNVLGEVTVLDGVTLTINPGVTMLFHDHYKLNIQGRLLAVGTEQDSIKFTIADTTGFSNHNIPEGGWHGVRFDNTPATNDSSKIEYCHLEYGKAVGDNWVERSGGSIYIYDYSKIIISHCIFKNNYAYDYGGAIYDTGGITIENSTLTNNNSGEWGGAIYTNGYPSGQLKNLTVNYNSALTGGGLYIENNPEIIHCKITNNQSSGIYIDNSSPKIINNIVCNNGGNGIYIIEIEWAESNPKITNCTIANNESYGIRYYYEDWWWPQNNGASINKNNEVMEPPSRNRNITGKNNVFSGNASGSIYSNVSASLTYCAFSDDLPSFAGIGCISTVPYFVDPTAGTGTNYNALEANWSLQSNSMCIDHGTPDTTGLYLPDIDLAGNPRVFQGNEPRIDIGAYEFQGEPDMIPDIYVYPYNFDFGLCTINDFSLEKSFMISNIGFTNLEITSITAPECFLIKREDDLEFGSAIDQFTVEVDSMKAINVIFNPNSAIIYSGNITINSNDPDENISTVGVTGIGDIYPIVYGNISEDTIWEADTIKVTGNITIEDGKTLTIDSGTNVRIMGSFSFDVQGRIIAEGTQQDTIVFTSKDSGSWWNGIKFDNTPATNDSSKFIHCRFQKATSNHGGAFYIINYSNIEISYCLLTNNKTRYAGGGIYLWNSDINLNNSIITNNIATGYGEWGMEYPGVGGGLCFINTDIDIKNCIITANEATSGDDYFSGGGIRSSASNLNLINCKILGNYADDGGKALSLRYSNVNIYNSIISQHDLYYGEVIQASDSTNISLTNTIIYNNSGINFEFFTWGTSNTLTSNYSCIEGGESSIITNGNATINWFENNIEENPLFIDPENGDFHLQSGSPCINAGTPSGWIVPYLNQPIDEILEYTCVEDNYDIGYYEYQAFMLDQNEIDFGDISFNTTSQSIQVTIANVGYDDVLITSIEATEYFLIKQNIEDVYSNQIGPIKLVTNSEVTFWIACHPLEDGSLEGEISIHTDAIPSLATIDVYANVSIIDILRLFPNYPNPFNTETTFKFLIPDDSSVSLTIFNIKGQKVKTLINSDCDRGFNTIVWHGLDDNGKRVSTGVYFYKLNVNGKAVKSKKMLLLK
ncbi:MAG: right-handed parallel beta-helix repeat-containing protein [Candidatus Cloacimonadota bacterium]|nr:right-handed parallel beta-helix repeat-containing protein [Candidatus Cloacimonadota bacterium]